MRCGGVATDVTFVTFWQTIPKPKHRSACGFGSGVVGWRLCAAGERKLLDEFLLARALQHDAPNVLLHLACDWLRAERIVRPPVDSPTRIARGSPCGPSKTISFVRLLRRPPI